MCIKGFKANVQENYEVKITIGFWRLHMNAYILYHRNAYAHSRVHDGFVNAHAREESVDNCIVKRDGM